MRAYVLLNFQKGEWTRDKMRGLLSILTLLVTNLINVIMKEHKC